MSRNFVFHKAYPIALHSEVSDLPAHLVRDSSKPIRARPSAIAALEALHRAAKAEGVEVIAISGHRGRDEQEELFRKGELRHGPGRAILWLAPPGYSEHHTGYVFDLADRSRPETDDEPSFESTPAFSWLRKNAARFGFELSFPRNNWQGVGYEPWHWRYAGDEKSRSIFHPNGAVGFLRAVCAVANGVAQRLR